MKLFFSSNILRVGMINISTGNGTTSVVELNHFSSAPAPQHWVLPVLFTSICFSNMRKKNPLIFKSDSRFSRVYPLFEYFYIYYFFHFRLQFFAMFGALLIFYLFSNCFPLLYKLMMFLLFFRMWCTHWPMLPVGRVDSR